MKISLNETILKKRPSLVFAKFEIWKIWFSATKIPQCAVFEKIGEIEKIGFFGIFTFSHYGDVVARGSIVFTKKKSNS